MESREFSARTVDEALTKATVELGVTSDKLDYEVVEKGSSGFLGLGSKEALIRVSLHNESSDDNAAKASADVSSESTEPDHSEPSVLNLTEDDAAQDNSSDDSVSEESEPVDGEGVKQRASEFLTSVFEAMGLEVELNLQFDQQSKTLSIEMSGPQMGIIIGKRGQTLDSLQYLTNLAINRKLDTYVRVKMDTEDYRKRRKATLENLAHNVAYKVKRTRHAVSLEAMNPYERRVIHYALQHDSYVTTYSEGEEPYRHVVVTLK